MAFGRLNQRSDATPMSDINMTPLIDVMLVLMVIFMFTTPFLTGVLPLELPSSTQARPESGPAVSVRVSMDRSGQLFLDAQAQSPQALAQALQTLAQRQPQAEVLLQVDETVAYGQVVGLMDLVQAAGLSRVGFVAKP